MVRHLAPPPDELDEPEKKIWRAIAARYGLNTVGAIVLHNGLRSHELARRAREAIDKQGLMVPGRNGLKVNPMTRVEDAARSLFFQTIKRLRINMEYEEDDRTY
jgi:phage terminase small subunit